MNIEALDGTIEPLEFLSPVLPAGSFAPGFANALTGRGAHECWVQRDAQTHDHHGPCFFLTEALAVGGDSRLTHGTVGNLLAIRTEHL